MKKVILTGVSGQLGQAFLKKLLDTGYYVYGLDQKISPELSLSFSENCSFHQVDITKEDQVVQFFQSVGEIYGVVNNAGIGVFTPFEQRTAQEFTEVMNVNLLGTFLMCREAVKKMKIQKRGKIINVGSIYGQVSSDYRIYGQSGRTNSEVYSMTKAGVIMFSRYLAAHYAEHGIQVNTLSPGGVHRAQTEDFVGNYKHRTPAGRMATPEDLTDTLQFLLADTNNYINGQNITIDGGFTSW